MVLQTQSTQLDTQTDHLILLMLVDQTIFRFGKLMLDGSNSSDGKHHTLSTKKEKLLMSLEQEIEKIKMLESIDNIRVSTNSGISNMLMPCHLSQRKES